MAKKAYFSMSALVYPHKNKTSFVWILRIPPMWLRATPLGLYFTSGPHHTAYCVSKAGLNAGELLSSWPLLSSASFRTR
eukprot:1283091-Rhodomonas_salina.2